MIECKWLRCETFKRESKVYNVSSSHFLLYKIPHRVSLLASYKLDLENSSPCSTAFFVYIYMLKPLTNFSCRKCCCMCINLQWRGNCIIWRANVAQLGIFIYNKIRTNRHFFNLSFSLLSVLPLQANCRVFFLL